MMRTFRCQGGLDLDANEILGVVEPAAPVLVGDRQPLVAYERQQDVGIADRFADHLDEVVAQLDRVDVLENLLVAEALGEPVEQPAGRVRGVLPPVADEDATLNVRGGLGHAHLLQAGCGS